MSETRLIPGGKSRTLRNTGFAYSPPCFPAQNSAFFFLQKRGGISEELCGEGRVRGCQEGCEERTQTTHPAQAFGTRLGGEARAGREILTHFCHQKAVGSCRCEQWVFKRTFPWEKRQKEPLPVLCLAIVLSFSPLCCP